MIASQDNSIFHISDSGIMSVITQEMGRVDLFKASPDAELFAFWNGSFNLMNMYGQTLHKVKLNTDKSVPIDILFSRDGDCVAFFLDWDGGKKAYLYDILHDYSTVFGPCWNPIGYDVKMTKFIEDTGFIFKHKKLTVQERKRKHYFYINYPLSCEEPYSYGLFGPASSPGVNWNCLMLDNNELYIIKNKRLYWTETINGEQGLKSLDWMGDLQLQKLQDNYPGMLSNFGVNSINYYFKIDMTEELICLSISVRNNWNYQGFYAVILNKKSMEIIANVCDFQDIRLSDSGGIIVYENGSVETFNNYKKGTTLNPAAKNKLLAADLDKSGCLRIAYIYKGRIIVQIKKDVLDSQEVQNKDC